MTDSSAPLTKKMLDDAFAAIAKQGTQPRHDCRFDGHVALFMATTCVHCHQPIRRLSPDENHIKYGELNDQ